MSLVARSLLAISLLSTTLASVAGAQQFAKPPQRAPQAQQQMDIGIVVDRDSVRAALVQARAQNIQAFIQYQQARSFPSNTHSDKALNVWRDRDGKYCAAATIILKSGNKALVEKVAEQSNFIKLGDVKQGPVMDWILTSGLTQAEIAMIQEPFMPVAGDEPMLVEPDLRAQETARLVEKYQQITAALYQGASANLDAATDRLMKSPQLAERFLAQRVNATN